MVLDLLLNKGEIVIMYCMVFLFFLVKGVGFLLLDVKLVNK